MVKAEIEWDRNLHIHTFGWDDSESDEQNFPYEPTPYAVLNRLAESGYIQPENQVLDYGCGKGRVCFFLAAQCGCRVKGIDFSEKLIRIAGENQARFAHKAKVCFQCSPAEKYEVQEEDRFFFFNPFTETILNSVLGKIRKSWYEKPRNILLFFYYPSDEFVTGLMTEPDLVFEDEIDCRDLFEGNNPRERILIFRMDRSFLS